MNKQKIGFIGLGWIGANYCSYYIENGFDVIQYDIGKYKDNIDRIKECDIVFVAVPTPSTPEGFDDSILIDAIKVTTEGQTVVIKSTVQLGTTDKMQRLYPDRYILHSPEFLTEKTAKYDVYNPARNIIGYTYKSKNRVGHVMNILPVAPYENIVDSRYSELVKYMGNIWFYIKVMTTNIFYDLATSKNLDYDLLTDMLAADKRVGRTHLDAVHQGGRGAGGDCFIKDMSAFMEMFKDMYLREKNEDMNKQYYYGYNVLQKLADYNIHLLKKSGKSADLLKQVYGENI